MPLALARHILRKAVPFLRSHLFRAHANLLRRAEPPIRAPETPLAFHRRAREDQSRQMAVAAISDPRWHAGGETGPARPRRGEQALIAPYPMARSFW